MSTRILVIKLSALGDFVLAFGPFAAIRAHYPTAEITLLTTAPFAQMARDSGWFDRVEIDTRPRWYDFAGLTRLRRRISGFDFTFDMQTSSRSRWYFYLAGCPKWSGISWGCSHRQWGPAREAMHTFERQQDQLRIAGITEFPTADLGFLTRTPLPTLPERFVLLVPGVSPTRRMKQWPVQNFAELAQILVTRGLTPVVIGGKAEMELGQIIRAACPETVDLTGQTSIAQLFALAARAQYAVGNDTGPLHICGAACCTCVALFSAAGVPERDMPRGVDGRRNIVVSEPVLADLPVARVVAALP